MQSKAATKAVQETQVSQLARFFPAAIRVRIPVSVEKLTMPGAGEQTVIEYGTSQELLFAVDSNFNFEDRVRVKNADGSLDAEASVVAVQLGSEGCAVAVRFNQAVPNWIIKGEE